MVTGRGGAAEGRGGAVRGGAALRRGGAALRRGGAALRRGAAEGRGDAAGWGVATPPRGGAELRREARAAPAVRSPPPAAMTDREPCGPCGGLLDYKTVKFALTRNRRVGLLHRLLQLGALGYLFG